MIDARLVDATHSGDPDACRALLREAVRQDGLAPAVQALAEEGPVVEGVRGVILETLGLLTAARPSDAVVTLAEGPWRSSLAEHSDRVVLLLAMAQNHRARRAVRGAFIDDARYTRGLEHPEPGAFWRIAREEGSTALAFVGLGWFLTDTLPGLRVNRFHAMEEDPAENEALEGWRLLLETVASDPVAPWVLAEVLNGMWHPAWSALFHSGWLWGEMPMDAVREAWCDRLLWLPEERPIPHRVFGWLAETALPVRAAQLYVRLLMRPGKRDLEHALKGLTRIGAASLPWVWPLLEAPLWYQRRQAAEVVAAIPHGGSEERLRAQLERERSKKVRVTLEAALGLVVSSH